MLRARRHGVAFSGRHRRPLAGEIRPRELAGEIGADFHEIVLLDSKDKVLRRFTERTRITADPAHMQARQMLQRHGGVAALSAMYDRVLNTIATRPAVKVIHSAGGAVEQTYQRMPSLT